MLYRLFTKTYKKAITGILVIAIAMPAAFASIPPKKVEAGFSNCMLSFGIGQAEHAAEEAAATPFVPVHNYGQSITKATNAGEANSTFLKDCIEKSFALALARMILQKMTNDIVMWINGGFNGSPAFMSNPGQFLLDAADEVAGAFIMGSDLAFLCSPFRLQIQLSLALNYSYSYERRVACTLSDVVNNIENAYEDFSEGGWGSWFSVTQSNQNNPYGSYLSASAQMSAQIEGERTLNLIKADWGGGFMSWEKCTNRATGETRTRFPQSGSVTVGNKTTAIGEQSSTAPQEQASGPGGEYRGEDCSIQTPGRVIGDTLQNQLDIPADQLGLADELDKIFNALAYQLIQKGLGAAGLGLGGGGLSGYSARGGNGKSIAQQLEEEAIAAHDAEKATAAKNMNQVNQANKGGKTPTDTYTGQNLALNKVATQSHTFGGYGPENLTDGNIKSSYDGSDENFTGSMAGIATNPWMRVNLGKTVKSIGKIIVYQRTNPGSSWSNASGWTINPQVTVQILDKDMKKVWESKQKYTQDYKGPVEIIVPGNESGQYIQIQAIGTTILMAAEIEAYQASAPKITLEGSNPMIITDNMTYEEPGYAAEDDDDGDITDKVVVGGDKVGKEDGQYVISYTVKNSAGIEATEVRQVIVQTASNAY